MPIFQVFYAEEGNDEYIRCLQESLITVMNLLARILQHM